VKKSQSIWDIKILRGALLDSVLKLNPANMTTGIHNRRTNSSRIRNMGGRYYSKSPGIAIRNAYVQENQ